jgi:hypothetical protein
VVRTRLKEGEEAERLLAQAREKLLGAEAIRPGSGAYSLACLSALQGDEAGCREWIEKSRELSALPRREWMMEDPDLDSVRQCEWFRRLLG